MINLYDTKKNSNLPVIMEPSKIDGKVDIQKLEFLQNKNILNFKVKHKIEIEKIGKIFNPTYCYLTPNFDEIFLEESDVNRLVPPISLENTEKVQLFMYRYMYRQKNLNLEYLKNKQELFYKRVYPKKTNNFPNTTSVLRKKKDFIMLNKLYFLAKILEIVGMAPMNIKIGVDKDGNEQWFKNDYPDFFDCKFYTKLCKVFLSENFAKKDFYDFYTELPDNLSNILTDKANDNLKFLEALETVKFAEYISTLDGDMIVMEKINIYENKELLSNLPPWLNIELRNKYNCSLESLSFGEKTMIRIFYTILNHIVSIDLSENSYDRFNIYFDEIEFGFHPQWQKEFLNELIIVLKTVYPKKKFHLIFLSHSPFLLSDIPKQNIIFLDKDEKGKCKVVNGLKEKKQTFGANIHTLLSDSFFMEDGLMGEFARGKIDKAITLLNQDKLSDDDLKYCEQIISIIGEPIIKNQLQRMLDSKRLKKIDEIDAIKQSMIEMQKRLDELEK